jgi:putative ABC transport system permease protein
MKRISANTTGSLGDAAWQAANRARRGTAGFAEYAGVAFDSLRTNKLRSAMTLLGIIIGITSIIVVICVLEGLDRYWKEKVSNFAPNTFVISQFPIITDPDEFFEAVRRNPEIRAEDASAIARHCSACDEVGVETERISQVRFGSQTLEQVSLSGVTANIFDIDPIEVEEGRVLLEWESFHSQYVAFIGWDISDKLFGNVDPLGKRIQVDGHWFNVVGVAARRGTVFGFSRDNFIRIPLSTYQKIYGSRRTANVSIRAREGRLQEAEDQARIVLRARHHLGYNDKDDFGVITSEGVNKLFDDLTRVIFSVILFVVGISLVVGGIVIMNIMLVSVVERTKEIGIRKAVGARQADIVNQFLVESVVLCCAGGGIGVVIAYGLSLLLAMVFPSSFPLWAPVLAFVLCSLIGVFFGIYPARRAGQLDPIEALRAE